MSFLQIHTLTAYPASLLNRDDAGLAKRIPFGNAIRLRVSSQCLKRHWRDDLTAHLPDIPDGQRTRSFFNRTVLPKAVALGVDPTLAASLMEPLAKAVVDGGVKESGDLKQPVLFGLREADYFAQILAEVSQESEPQKALSERLKSKDEKANMKAMKKSAAGLTAALFGRMVTSDFLSRVDAPVHVAHAMTIHAANTEMDYFTVVDDLNQDDETGAAHANQSELGAGIYYGYVAVDIPLLVSNLTGCEVNDWRDQDNTIAMRVLQSLVYSILQQSPGAKKGSTAPYAWADAVLLEAGTGQPRTLANAFLEAIPLKNVQQDPRVSALGKMADYLTSMDAMYGASREDAGYYRGFSSVLHSLPQGLPHPAPVSDNLSAALDTLWRP